MAQQLDPAIFGARPKNLCAAAGCTRPRHQKKRLCVGHVRRRWKKKVVGGELRPWKRDDEPRGPCRIAGCARPIQNHKHQLCGSHYLRLLRGRALEGPIAERREKQMVSACVHIGQQAAAVLKARAGALRVSRSALARQVLEDWAKATLRGE